MTNDDHYLSSFVIILSSYGRRQGAVRGRRQTMTMQKDDSIYVHIVMILRRQGAVRGRRHRGNLRSSSCFLLSGDDGKERKVIGDDGKV